MQAAKQKIVQYLHEAQASERALVRVLQSQIAMTPRGTYRTALESHLAETRTHVRRVDHRLRELGHGETPVQLVVGLVETVVGQALALTKTPIDLVRGSGGEEKVLKNAKDTCATEALEIATYTALERLAEATGDTDTARMAASIREDEETMLARVLREIPKLTDAVVGAEIHGDPSYDITTTGAAESVVAGYESAKDAVDDTVTAAKRATRAARKDVGVDEPWPGYDELTVAEVQAVLAEGDEARAREVGSYERAHKNRAGVLKAIDRVHAGA